VGRLTTFGGCGLMTKNPYNPTFGKLPERFLGREIIIDEILNALNEPNSPWSTTLLIGIRGSGKTAILSDIKRLIKDENVIVVSVTPEMDFLDDILGQLYRNLPKSLLSSIPKPKTISFAGFQFEANNNKEPYFTNTFRYQITSMLDFLKSKKYRVLFLIDESQRHSEQMRTFVATYQHLITENYKLTLVMAGLPNVISDILNDDVLTFLRRSNQVELQSIDIELVKLDYYDVFCNNFSVEKTIIDQAATDTKGYPYLIQLIGYYLWRNLSNGVNDDLAHQNALVMAKSTLNQNVHKMLYNSLSAGEKDFVHAMAQDNEFSYVSEIMNRLSKSKNYISTYRIRLIESGYIKSAGHGKVEFVMPYTNDFLNSINS